MERAGVGDSGGWKWSGVGRRGCCVLGVRAGAGPESIVGVGVEWGLALVGAGVEWSLALVGAGIEWGLALVGARMG